jgi:hypothetical protein
MVSSSGEVGGVLSLPLAGRTRVTRFSVERNWFGLGALTLGCHRNQLFPPA